MPGVLTRRRRARDRRVDRGPAASRRDDPLVPGRALRPVEPRRGRHGADRRRHGRRGRPRLPVARSTPSSPTAAGSTTTWRPASRTPASTPTSAPTWRPGPGTTTSRPATSACLERALADGRGRRRLRAALAAGRRVDPVVARPCGTTGGVRAAHRFVLDLPQPPLRDRDRRAPRPGASRLGAGRGPPRPRRGPRTRARSPRRSSSPWTGTTRSSRARSPASAARSADRSTRGRRFVMEGRGVRCVSTGEWVTAAETAECVLTLDALGLDDAALELLTWVQALRNDGRLLLDRHGLPRGGDLPAARALLLHRRRDDPRGRRGEPDHSRPRDSSAARDSRATSTSPSPLRRRRSSPRSLPTAHRAAAEQSRGPRRASDGRGPSPMPVAPTRRRRPPPVRRSASGPRR